MKNTKNEQTARRSFDEIAQRLSVICNSTWPQEDRYLGQAVAEIGMTIDAFGDLADEVKFAILRGEDHPRAELVNAVQQRAFRFEEAAQPQIVELPEP